VPRRPCPERNVELVTCARGTGRARPSVDRTVRRGRATFDGMRRATSSAGVTLAATLVLGGACACRGGGEDGARALAASTARTAAAPLDVEVQLPLSGPDAAFGEEARRGVDLAFAESLARGAPVRAVFVDDAIAPERAAMTVGDERARGHELEREREPDVWLGGLSSRRAEAAGSVAVERGVPFVTPSATADSLTRGRTGVFRACLNDTQLGEVAARYALDVRHATRVGLLYAQDDGSSVSVATSFKNALDRRGRRLVAEIGFPRAHRRFTRQVTALGEAGVDVVFAPVSYVNMIAIARDARETGDRVPGRVFVGADQWSSPALFAEAGAALEGAAFIDHFVADAPGDSTRRFVAAYRHAYGAEPGVVAALAYDAAAATAIAWQRSATPTRSAMRESLGRIRDLAGATGTLAITEGGDARKSAFVVSIRGGKPTYAAELAPDSEP
jgi:branched-chain amino acid transport system substrate-binding protein